MESPFLFIQKHIIWLISTYQFIISPILGHHCRFQITCSQYSIQSIKTFGIIQGIWMTFIRVLHCHPLADNNNEDFIYYSYSHIQDVINMDSQRNFFLIAFLIMSFILWQTWQTEHYQDKNIQTIINTRDNIYTLDNAENDNEITYSYKENHLITVETDVFLLKINTYGGDIEEAYLMNYQENLNSKTPYHLLCTKKNFVYNANINIINETSESLKKPFFNKKFLYTTSNNQDTYKLLKKENTLKVSLIHHDNNGIKYTKNYTFNRNDYSIHVDYIISNMSNNSINIKLLGNLVQSISYPIEYNNRNNDEDSFPLYSYRGTIYSTDKKKYQKYSFKDIKKSDLNINTSSGWIAMSQKYFATAWIPLNQGFKTFYTTFLDQKNAIIGFQTSSIHIPMGQQETLQSILWMGPKVQKKMTQVNQNLDLIIDYGWLWFISQPLFNLLNLIHEYVNNWGISIVITTLIIRFIMYPLTKAQYTSMAKIRMLQPKLSAIHTAYKHDKYQYHQNTIKLYKEEKLNPLGGCLPVLIQMPIFLALYYMLSSSVELRHANFIFWIHDLSAPDPYCILPILMGITMFYIQKISPNAIGDTIQKNIMTIMLIIFTIFFLWFPSGLVLYYIVSNIITIIQQQMIYKVLEKKGLQNKQR
ncbi:membrane protein insertase YidC [Candidatus Blochmannia ocreatus (nom. nud.)]|uniref:Multifunctional fusion protein n=1 Tax=Candidatus Blochmannia ocreatus (nom. nud.) TaxID=251538 RepID=A0ABY4SYR5_9ENTR|nr:membrane protein insertase YidC [Candidatus Blochmannia ocreatus]URJ25107.1 membrane protein insertase YidC [Candidatus Blochmannia ocreatus]